MAHIWRGNGDGLFGREGAGPRGEALLSHSDPSGSIIRGQWSISGHHLEDHEGAGTGQGPGAGLPFTGLARRAERGAAAGRAREAYDKGARFLLLDLAKVETLTSAGMRAMQKVYKLFTPSDEQYKVSHLKLCKAPPEIHHLLGITGFLQNIPNYETQEAAVDAFGA